MPERNEGGVRLRMAAPLKLGRRELRPGEVVRAELATANDLIRMGRAELDETGGPVAHDLTFAA